MENKKVKQMMVDIERNDLRNQLGDDFGGLWVMWFDGVCVASSGGNFLWANKHTVSIFANGEKHD